MLNIAVSIEPNRNFKTIKCSSIRHKLGISMLIPFEFPVNYYTKVLIRVNDFNDITTKKLSWLHKTAKNKSLRF